MGTNSAKKITILASLIFDERGRVTSQRILEVNGPKVEASITATGVMKDLSITDMSTYTSVPKQDGQFMSKA